MTQKPAAHSSASMNGPSVETGSSPRPSITVEVVGSASPAAKTQLPPAISFSVKTSIAACSSAVPDSLL